MRKKLLFFLFIGLFSVETFSQDIPEYCLENDKVHAYLNRGTYKSDDYTYTWIRDYCYDYPWNWKVEGHGVRLDIPKPVPITLPSALAVASTLYVSESEDYEDAYTMTIPAGQVSADVYNLIPGRTYNYKVEYDDGGVMTVATSGQFKTTGHLRMLKIDGIFNVRDMGGWVGLGGKTIKYGKLIRGSRMNVNGSSQELITAEGKKALLAVGVRADLDLRDAGDAVNRTTSFLGNDIPIKNINGAYGSRIATFADKPQSIQGIKQIIAWFKQDRPVYFHCSVGADRTGTVAYLIGALCGMSEDALCKEFELTSFSADSITNSRDAPNPERLIRQRTYEGRLDPNDDPDSYKFANMVDKIKTFPGATLQRKVYNHLLEGVSGENIPAEDLAFLVKYLTDYSLPSGIKTNVDTLNLDYQKTFQLTAKVVPDDAESGAITYRSSNNSIATVSDDGLVTAMGGGETSIIVTMEGIEKIIPIIVPITEESVVGFTVENEVVSRYLSEVSYDSNDYTVSQIEKYDTITTSYMRDWPAPVTLQWAPTSGITDQYVVVSKLQDYSNPVSEGAAVNAVTSSYRIEGLCPQQIYYYSIAGTMSGKAVYLSKSAFKTIGTVRMVKTQYISNIRDLGGWTGLEGHKVRYGAIFRGSRLRESVADGGMALTDATDNSTLRGLGIGAELELRTAEECTATSAVLNKRQVKFAKVPNAADCQGANILTGDAYIVALNTIIGWAKSGKGVYVSSGLGAHRTGTMAFLINGLLGVDEESLSKDYELSSFSEDTKTDVLCKRTDADFTAMITALKSLTGETLQKKIYNYFKTGVGGTSVPEEDLVWFINYMLDAEVITPTSVPYISNAGVKEDGKIYNLLGQEVLNPGKGVYIRNGKKFIVR